jgi:hypothetical protein
MLRTFALSKLKFAFLPSLALVLFGASVAQAKVDVCKATTTILSQAKQNPAAAVGRGIKLLERVDLLSNDTNIRRSEIECAIRLVLALESSDGQGTMAEYLAGMADEVGADFYSVLASKRFSASEQQLIRKMIKAANDAMNNGNG